MLPSGFVTDLILTDHRYITNSFITIYHISIITNITNIDYS